MWRLKVVESSKGGGRLRFIVEGAMGIAALVSLLLLLISEIPPYVFLLPLVFSLLLLALLFPDLDGGMGTKLLRLPPWRYVLRKPIPVRGVNVKEEYNAYMISVRLRDGTHRPKVDAGILHHRMGCTYFYTTKQPVHWNREGFVINVPLGPTLISRGYVVLPSIRMYFDDEEYFLSPVGSSHQIRMESGSFSLGGNIVVVVPKGRGITFRLVKGNCDRCILSVVYTVGTPLGEIKVENVLGSLLGVDRSIVWNPPEGRYVLLFRRRDIGILEEFSDVPVRNLKVETSAGTFYANLKVVVEVSRFGQWTRKRTSAVYRSPSRS